LRRGAARQQQDTGANHKIDVHCCPHPRGDMRRKAM
jgi:hypothetical protein